MGQFLGFGTGIDGAVPSSGTYAGTYSTCSGTSGSTTLNKSATFTAGDFVLIHQTRGTGVGQWEINQVSSDGGGATLTLVQPLSYTYTDSGNSQAQVVEIKEYTGGDITGTLGVTAWGGDTGGILPMMISGKLTISGTLSAAGASGTSGSPGTGGSGGGFRGGNADVNNAADAAEGSAGPSVVNQETSNGTGGGGGTPRGAGAPFNAGGGSGGHVNAGTEGGYAGTPGGSGGDAGAAASDTADLTNMQFGGGGGGGTEQSGTTGGGGSGGGIIVVFAKELEITGTVTVKGGDAIDNDGSAGAGGSVFLKGITLALGTNKITAAGGSDNGGLTKAGSIGRVRAEGCVITGSISAGSYSESEGGYNFCASANQIL